jgi:hypothetical protein
MNMSCLFFNCYNKKTILSKFINKQCKDEYKNNNCIKVCELCGEHDRIEIDHHSEKMPFAKLYVDFMEMNKLPIPTSFNNTKGHIKCFNELDHTFEETWKQYHKENE